MNKSTIIKYITRFFIPEKCMFCREIITTDTCEGCKNKIKPYTFSEKEMIITATYRDFKYIDFCISFYDYKNIVKDAIIRAKFYNCSAFLSQFFQYIPIDFDKFMRENDIDIIVSSPSHKSKFYYSEFDIPMEMAKIISKHTNICYDNKVIVKEKITKKQHELSRDERKTNLKDAFIVKKEIKNKSILVIDDILTTGHTVDEIAKVLKKSGAKKVIAMTFGYNKQ